MARPRSEDKQEAILNAAIQVFANRDLAAPTAAISEAAGIAEGTLFTYFPTKDDLLNALYRTIRLHVAHALMSGPGQKKDARSKLQHIWNAYANWGVANPDSCKVLARLQVSGKLTAESKAAGAAPFAEIEVMACDAIASGLVRPLPMEFIAAAMESLVATTIQVMARNPSQSARFRRLGFEMFWNGIAES